jgi:uncharacterized protein YecE (DUF72 family)
MRCDLPRLTAFLQALRRRAPRLRHAIEFRHTSWYDDSVFALLARYRVALCLHDKSEGGYLGEPIGPFAYVRFHGPSGAYHGGYAASDLAAWAERMRGWSTKGLDAYGYFNNDVAGMAPHDAATLIGLVNRA